MLVKSDLLHHAVQLLLSLSLLLLHVLKFFGQRVQAAFLGIELTGIALQ